MIYCLKSSNDYYLQIIIIQITNLSCCLLIYIYGQYSFSFKMAFT